MGALGSRYGVNWIYEEDSRDETDAEQEGRWEYIHLEDLLMIGEYIS